jgi:hypothetical protein
LLFFIIPAQQAIDPLQQSDFLASSFGFCVAGACPANAKPANSVKVSTDFISSSSQT